MGIQGEVLQEFEDKAWSAVIASDEDRVMGVIGILWQWLGIPLAALGILSPIIAGAAMALSSVSVVSNSLLLKRTYHAKVSQGAN